MYTLLKPLQVREELLKRGMTIFTPLDFSRLYPLPPYKIKYFLEQQVKTGLLARLKQGLYTLKTDIPSEEEIANRLYQPSYISFEYALAFYNILPEMVYTVSSATTKPTRQFSVSDKEFSYFKIKNKAYTGYQLTKVGNRSFVIAEPEKAFVDYLYFVALGKKSVNDRLDTSSLNKDKAIMYAHLYGRPRLNQLIQEVL